MTTSRNNEAGSSTGQFPGKTGGDTYGGQIGVPTGPSEVEPGGSIGNRGPDPAPGEDHSTETQPRVESPNAEMSQDEGMGTDHSTER